MRVRHAIWTLLLLVSRLAAAATVPTGFVDTPIVAGLTRPTAMAFAPDGRLFVCEQDGTLRVIKNGVLLSAPFVSVPVDSSGERGLLGVTFDPEFATNGFVYIYYTATTPTMHNRVSRFVANGDVATPGSEDILMDLEPLGATNHNGGAIHFGPDGKLYVAVGDNAIGDNAQTLENRLGKILRVNADGSIPESNPFFTVATGENRAIWALGLRNPFTFAFRDLTGEMYINDVGELTWEEINRGTAGANYGWPETEGPTSDPRFVAPVFAYQHNGNLACAISGGAFHKLSHSQFPGPGFWGTYYYADFCGGRIKYISVGGSTIASDLASGVSRPVDLQSAPDGSLYYLARGTGTNTGVVSRISYAVTAPKVDISANGGDEMLFLGAGMPLRLELAFTAGGVTWPSAELYVGVQTSAGVFLLNQSGVFVQTTVPIPAYVGPLPTFGPSPLIRIPDVALLPPGVYFWFLFVDRQHDSLFIPESSDFVVTVVQ